MADRVLITPPEPKPSPSALRRALRRAADGVALDVTEAAVLLPYYRAMYQKAASQDVGMNRWVAQ